jgi:hypothetical protein
MDNVKNINNCVLILVGIYLRYGLDGRGFDSGQGKNISRYSTVSRLDVGPIKSPIQWTPWLNSPQVKRVVREAGHTFQSSIEVKNTWIYTSTPHASSWRAA